MGSTASIHLSAELSKEECKEVTASMFAWTSDMDKEFESKSTKEGKIKREDFLDIARTMGLVFNNKKKKFKKRHAIRAEKVTVDKDFKYKKIDKPKDDARAIRKCLKEADLFSKFSRITIGKQSITVYHISYYMLTNLHMYSLVVCFGTYSLVLLFNFREILENR